MVLWKKLLLEFSAVGGFGGGVGGWAGNLNRVVYVEEEDDNNLVLIDSISDYKRKEIESKYKTKPWIVKELDKPIFGFLRYRGEGVNRQIPYFAGWEDGEIKYKVIESKEFSQGDRNLFQGIDIGNGGGWFGPRADEKDELQQAYAGFGGNSETIDPLWELMQNIFEFIEKKDLSGMSEFLNYLKTNFEGEELGMREGRGYWINILRREERDNKVFIDIGVELS